MTGQELYSRYAELNEEIANCELDSWDTLSDEEKNVWEDLASELEWS